MPFHPDALPTLIGSLPLSDHRLATRVMLEYTPEIPLWVQLPRYPEERLLSQFAENLPGLRGSGDSLHLDPTDPEFETELLRFYEEYLGVTEAGKALEGSIFAFSHRTGRGFSAFLHAVSATPAKPVALKGQITGPFTMLTGLKDSAGRLAYFHPQLREMMVKALSLKARYQAEAMGALGRPVMVFLDEPALAGFGSSAMVGATREDVISDLSEVIESVHQAGGLAGIHVCANTDWSLVLSTPVDVLSFDAYGFFDRLLLYKDYLDDFLSRGKIVAWGLVPTLDENDLKSEGVESLKARWDSHVARLGLDRDMVRGQALITPSCGTGLLSEELSLRAMALTRDLSRAIRRA